MYIVFIDGVIIAALIFGGLMAGAGVTDVLVNIINKHQTALTVFVMLSGIGMSISGFLEVRSIIKKMVYIALNIFFDCIIQIGVIVLIFTELKVISAGFDNHFIGMIFMFIPALMELLFIACIAVGGGCWIPAMMNKIIGAMDEMNISGFITIALNIICKVIYGTVFLAGSCFFMQAHYSNSYNAIFQGTIYDSIIRIPMSWMENLTSLIAKLLMN